MDAPEKKSPLPPKEKRTLALHARNILLWVVIIGAIVAAGIWYKNQTDKARNLQDSVLQELKQSQKIALEAVAADSSAKELLGDDIKDAGGLARDGSGEIDRTGTVLHFDVAGSKQKGRVTAPAAMEKGSWQITGEIDVKAADGKTIKVAKPGEKPPDINLDL
jgi:Cytochrome oxidase complex assembly protein 1